MRGRPNSRPKGIDWSRQPLGELSDRALGQSLGCSGAAVRWARVQREIPPHRAKRPPCDPDQFGATLGRETDREVAQRHGVTASQVARARRARGIPSTRVDWSAQPLGEAPDIVLARRHGVDVTVVAKARWARGIPKWREGRTCPCGAPFIAFHFRQKFCSHRCQRYHWQLIHRKGYDPEVADLGIAMRAYRATLKRKG